MGSYVRPNLFLQSQFLEAQWPQSIMFEAKQKAGFCRRLSFVIRPDPILRENSRKADARSLADRCSIFRPFLSYPGILFPVG